MFVPIKASQDFINSPKGLAFESSGSKQARKEFKKSSNTSSPIKPFRMPTEKSNTDYESMSEMISNIKMGDWVDDVVKYIEVNTSKRIEAV
jgi:hypothetical protein